MNGEAMKKPENNDARCFDCGEIQEWVECETCGGGEATGQSACIDDICHGGEVP